MNASYLTYLEKLALHCWSNCNFWVWSFCICWLIISTGLTATLIWISR